MINNTYLRAARNLTVVNSLIARFMVEGFALQYRYKKKDPILWRKKALELCSHLCKILLKHVDFQVEYTYSRPDLFNSGKRYYMVANHMSYMDMAFLSVGEPSVFVTSVEMQNTPFLGDIAKLGGSYFIERRDRSKVPGEVKEMAQLIKDDFDVFVFPEGTSTHGMHILPFKRALFTTAIEAGVEVLPVCIRYEMVDGEPFSAENKDLICWHGDMGFAPHFLKVMTMKSLKLSVNYLEPISSKEFPDRAQLADQAYDQISRCYFANRPDGFEAWPYPPEVQERIAKLKALGKL